MTNPRIQSLLSAPDNSPEMKIRASFRNKEVGAKADQSIKPIFMISLFSDNHKDKNLNAILQLMKWTYTNGQEHFNKVDILIAGTLQRHNFWNFTPQLSDESLSKLLQAMPGDMTIAKLALELAERLYPLAKKAEASYVDNNAWTIRKLLPRKLFSSPFIWEEKVPIRNVDMATPRNYFEYYEQLRNKYLEDTELAKAFTKTTRRMLDIHQNSILVESMRILKANTIIMQMFEGLIDQQVLSDNVEKLLARNNQVLSRTELTDLEKKKLLNAELLKLAVICSTNLLLEECASLVDLYDCDYRSIIYPAPKTPAFDETLKMFPDKPFKWLEINLEKSYPHEIKYALNVDNPTPPSSPLSAPLSIKPQGRIKVKKVKVEEVEEIKEAKETTEIKKDIRDTNEMNEVKVNESITFSEMMKSVEVEKQQLGFIPEGDEEEEKEDRLKYKDVSYKVSDPFKIEKDLSSVITQPSQIFIYSLMNDDTPSLIRSTTTMIGEYDLPEHPHDLKFDIDLVIRVPLQQERNGNLKKPYVIDAKLGKEVVTGCKPKINDPRLSFPINTKLFPSAIENFIFNAKLNTALTRIGFFKSSWCDPKIDMRLPYSNETNLERSLNRSYEKRMR